MYPAKNGDAFLVRSAGGTQTAILIDGGFGETFRGFIAPDLGRLAEAGYQLDLVIASHIDADHIGGLLEFFKRNGNASAPALIKVAAVWHNSVRAISAQVDTVASYDLPILRAAAARGYPADPDISAIEQISAGQGSSLAALLLAGQYQWNEGVGRSPIATEAEAVLNNGVFRAANIELLGPTKARLTNLQAWWKAELQKKGFASNVGSGDYFDDAFEFMCARSELQTAMAPPIRKISATSQSLSLDDVYSQDKSVTNASSISVSIELDGKTMLFIGDSVAEDLIEQLKGKSVGGRRLWFDAIKVSHHGSAHNTSPELLALIDSDTFLISSNGNRHGHPDFPVLKAIVDRPAAFTRALHFNYSTPASRKLKEYVSEAGAAFVVYENSTNWLTLT